MGRKVKKISITPAQRVELEHGYKHGKSVMSRRCHMILLKSDGRASRDIADILGIHPVSVNNWVSRFESSGMDGLKTKPGQGRKSILSIESDSQKVKEAVKNERQRLKNAKDDLEADIGKKFSLRTLKRFLKNLTAVGSVSG